ncbi:Fic family protein [Candidatus Woesebacteria bacterium]|nr:Fic family protein [Candidatus Woesebacteria bacterium]
MLIPPKYFLTPKISQLLSSIEASKEVIDSVSIPPLIEQNIRRASTLRSSLFSARIEGNPLTMEEIPHLPSKDQKKVEVYNILKALNWIHERSLRDIYLKDVLTLHSLALRGIVDPDDLGKFRTTHEAIFTSSGIPIFHAPPPSQIDKMLQKLLRYINSSKEPLVPIRAVLAHYTFEKIHPFVDGSGRVGRLLIQIVLAKGGYGLKGILPLEEKIDQKRETYYKMLEEPERDVTDYVEFMLELISEAANQTKEVILEKRQVEPEDLLLPRRAEIYKIIKDQTLINFNSIKRRFLKVNERTLRYDLKKLQEARFIKKLGTTKGVYYKPAD